MRGKSAVRWLALLALALSLACLAPRAFVWGRTCRRLCTPQEGLSRIGVRSSFEFPSADPAHVEQQAAIAKAEERQLEELLEAYDGDRDGIMEEDEVKRFENDIGYKVNVPGELYVHEEDIRQRYSMQEDDLLADHTRIMQPQAISMISMGSVVIIAFWLSSTLTREVLENVDGDGYLEEDVGRGPLRLRKGWKTLDRQGGTRTGDRSSYMHVQCPTDDAEEFTRRAIPVYMYTHAGKFIFHPALMAGTDVEVLETLRIDVPDMTKGMIVPKGTKGVVAMLTVEGDVLIDFYEGPSGGLECQKGKLSFLGRKPVKVGVPVQLPGMSWPKPKKKTQDSGSSDGFGAADDLSRMYRSVQEFKRIKPSDPSYVPMESFCGSPEVKEKLQELVDVLSSPDKYARVGAVPPKGVLFTGEPGTGKTFAARAIASTAGVPFLAISGSEFRQSPFSGVGTAMTMRMFDQAEKQAPCIIFIDEIDSLAEARRQGSSAILDAGELGGSVTRDQDSNLNALLAKMDGFNPNSGVLFLAATNRPEVLDAALLRSGRFDQRLEFKLPNKEGREEILRRAATKLQLSETEGPDLEEVAVKTPAFSPADLQTLLNSAATAVVRTEREHITAKDVDECLQQARERKSKVRPEGSFQVTDVVNVTLSDVRGHAEAIDELRDIVDAIQHRERYEKVGATPPRGVLLEGLPGVGKTHCARALAGEVGLPFIAAAGSDFQAHRYAGSGVILVKKLFEMARKLQPCVLFIDEVDAIGRRRDSGARGAEQDRENTMMQLLVELDGFEDRAEILLVAATNRSDVLDPALLRAGRLERRVVLETPDQAGRQDILDLYCSKKPLDADVDLAEVSRRTAGFTGADIQNLINEAALVAAKAEAETIARDSIYKAADRISLGMEKAQARSAAARELVAIHEAGHALIGAAFAHLTQQRLARVSIRPRAGGIGGVTIFEPLGDTESGALPRGVVTKRGCLAQLCVELGGRVAEEAMLPHSWEVSSGASGDFRSASSKALAMVTEWGLAPEAVLSTEAIAGRRCSDITLREHEVLAGKFMNQALGSARAIVQSSRGRELLRQVADKLLEHEQCDAAELLSETECMELQGLAIAQAESWN